MKRLVIYVHGKGGCAEEAKHYERLFPDSDVIGLDYRAQTPWEAREEFPRLFDLHSKGHGPVLLIANSIGAFLSMCALADKHIDRAMFISPVVDMERLIQDMMRGANVTEDELERKKQIPTAFGETLSWAYLCDVRRHPVRWSIPTRILYGGRDQLTSRETISGFADRIGAELTVMEDGEHWFHTEEQMNVLDRWISSPESSRSERGEQPMHVIYERKPAMTFIGFSTAIRPEEGYRKCPEFWEREYSRKYARLWQTMKPENPVEAAILENGIGMFAICDEKEGAFEYWIAGLYRGGEVPQGLKLYAFPESDWAMFSAKGPLPGSLQALNTQVWQEWYPGEGKKYRGNGSAMLEVYTAGDMQSPDYECGIWVPVCRREGEDGPGAAQS